MMPATPQNPAEGVDGGLPRIHIDTREAGRLFVAAQRAGIAAQHGLAQDKAGDDRSAEQDNDRVGISKPGMIEPAPNPSRCGGRRGVIEVDWLCPEITSERPLVTIIMPSVAMKGGTFIFEMSRPFTKAARGARQYRPARMPSGTGSPHMVTNTPSSPPKRSSPFRPKGRCRR
jgi:hypothetical protein